MLSTGRQQYGLIGKNSVSWNYDAAPSFCHHRMTQCERLIRLYVGCSTPASIANGAGSRPEYPLALAP